VGSVIGVVVLVAATAVAGCGNDVAGTTSSAVTSTSATATTGTVTPRAAAGSGVGTGLHSALTPAAPSSAPPVAAAPVTTRVALPTAGTATTATVTATVTGTVRRGGAACLFLTTDAGQLFRVAGVLDPALSAALPRRDGRPALTSPHGAAPAADRPAASEPGLPTAAPSVRIRASGTVSPGPGSCGSRWTITVLRGRIG